MKSSPPRRLIDDPTVSAELRQDLEQSAAATSNYDVTAGLAALQSTLGNLTPSQPPPTTLGPADQVATSSAAAGTSAGLSVAGKIGLSVASAALAVGVVLGVQTSSAPANPHNEAVLPHAVPSNAPQTAKTAIDGAASSPVASDSSEPPAATRAPERLSAVTAVTSPGAPKVAARRRANTLPSSLPKTATASGDRGNVRLEIDELAQIKSLLPVNPAAAYRLASRGHARSQAPY